MTGRHDGTLVRGIIHTLLSVTSPLPYPPTPHFCAFFHSNLSATALAASSCPEAAVGKSAAKASVPGFGA